MIGIGFGASDSWRSRLIRWATGGNWSHTWIEYPSTCWGGQWVAHSTERGVVKEPANRVHARYDRYVLFASTDIDLANGMKESAGLVGRRYDFKVIWNVLLLVLSRFIGYERLVRFALKDISKMTCSEFVTTVMRRAEVPDVQALEPEFMTPSGLYKVCQRSKYFRKA